MKDIQVLRRPPVEVAQSECRTAHEPDARNVTGIAKLGDEITQAEGSRHDQAECRSSHTREGICPSEDTTFGELVRHVFTRGRRVGWVDPEDDG